MESALVPTDMLLTILRCAVADKDKPGLALIGRISATCRGMRRAVGRERLALLRTAVTFRRFMGMRGSLHLDPVPFDPLLFDPILANGVKHGMHTSRVPGRNTYVIWHLGEEIATLEENTPLMRKLTATSMTKQVTLTRPGREPKTITVKAGGEMPAIVGDLLAKYLGA